MPRSIPKLPSLLARGAEKFSEAPFAIDAATGRALSFEALQASSERVAAALQNRFGIKPGQHVAILLPNCVEILPIYFGILRAGAVFVPTNARLKADEFQFILQDSEAQAVFVHPATWKPAQEGLKTLAWNRPVISVGFDAAPEGTIAFTEILAESSALAPVSAAT